MLVLTPTTMAATPGETIVEEADVGLTAVNPVISDGSYSRLPGGSSAPVSGGTSVGFGRCDDCTLNIALPFNFEYYGTNYTTACLSSNGLITFGSCSWAFINSIHNLGNIRGIAGSWDDYEFSPGCASDNWYRTDGAGWTSLRFQGRLRLNGACSSVNFMVTLHSNSNIVFDYARYDIQASATAGISRGTGGTPLWVYDNEFMNFKQGVTYTPGDSQPPVTTATLSGTLGTAGWYRSSVTATLTATDVGSGVASTWISLDGQPASLYTGPQVVTAEGSHTVTYWSRDNAGNTESANSKTFGIDLTPPVVAITAPIQGRVYVEGNDLGDSPDGSTLVVGTMTFTATATDNVSGIANRSWYLDGAWVSSGANFTYSSSGYDTHTLEFRARDFAGNAASAFMNFTRVGTAASTAPSTGAPLFETLCDESNETCVTDCPSSYTSYAVDPSVGWAGAVIIVSCKDYGFYEEGVVLTRAWVCPPGGCTRLEFIWRDDVTPWWGSRCYSYVSAATPPVDAVRHDLSLCQTFGKAPRPPALPI